MTIETALNIVKSPTINMDELEKVLNALSHEDRLAVTRKFTPKIQKNLFAAAEGRPVSVEQIVPSESTLEEIIHEGTNTIPIFRTFQKRFSRPVKSENKDAIGYNHNWYGALTAPGYFVCDQDEANGEFVIDYTQLPTEKVDSWPKIISNNSMLGFLIWAGMKDRLRQVSDHVTIGRAYKKKPMNAYFTLCRVD